MSGQKFKVTITTEDGEVVEQFTTAPILNRGHRLAEEILMNAAAMSEIGLNEWEDEDEDAGIDG